MTNIRLTFEELERLARSDGWVQGLARRLVGDASLAEDVVQEAYLVALSSANPPRGSLKAWLAGVIRNVAHSRMRDEGRRRYREERGARAESVGATDESVGRLEQQGILIQSLLELPEPYREALILRYVECLAPRQVAKRLDTPVATINSRLARGLDKLRTQLDLVHDGDRTRWMTAFAPLLAPPSKVTPLTLGGLLLNTKLLIAATVALVFLAGTALFDFTKADSAIDRGAPMAEATLPMADPTQPQTTEVAKATERVAGPVATSEVTAPRATTLMSIALRDADSQELLPGASLWMLRMEDLYRSQAEVMELQSRLPWSMRDAFRERGRRFTADEEGRVMLPMEEDRALLFAESGELRVAEDVRLGESEVDLFLGPDRPISVRVLDSAGLPRESIPVALAARVNHGGDQPVLHPLSTSTTSGPDGMAQLLLTQQGVVMAGDMELVVALSMPLEVEVSKTVDLGMLPKTPVDLQMPATGEVQLRILRDGSPVQEELIVQLAPGAATESVEALYGQHGLRALSAKGNAFFGPVGLNTQLLAGVMAPGTADFELVHFAGPTRPGQRLLVDLELRSRATRVTGRALEAESGEVATGTIFVERPNQLTASLQLDEKGRFDQVFGFLPEENELLLMRYGRGGEFLELRVPLPILRGGSIDLGDLQFESLAPPVLPNSSSVTGRVIDAKGAPVQSAMIRWVLRNEERGTWVPVGAPMALTSQDGEFQLEGDLPDPEACLEINSNAGWFEPAPVAVPSRDLVLQLGAPVSLVGALLLDEGVSVGALSMGLWSTKQGTAPKRLDVYGWESANLDQKEFTFAGLAPGIYTFRLEPDGHRSAGVVIESVEVREQDSRDPRLDPLDLRGDLRSFRLRVVDEQGQRIQASVYAIRDGRPGYLGHTERAAFTTSMDLPEAFVIEAEGYFPVSLDPHDLPEQVVLRRGIEVPMEWTGSRALADLPFRLELELSPLEAPAVPGGQAAAAFMARVAPSETFLDGDAPRVLTPGRYRLRVSSSLEEPQGYFWGRTLELPGLEIVEVRETSEAIRISLEESLIEAEDAWLIELRKR